MHTLHVLPFILPSLVTVEYSHEFKQKNPKICLGKASFVLVMFNITEGSTEPNMLNRLLYAEKKISVRELVFNAFKCTEVLLHHK